jgi:hypothetical protein
VLPPFLLEERLHIPLFRLVLSSFVLHTKEAARLRGEADSLPHHGTERLSLLRKAQQRLTIENWITSPGLQRRS